VREGKTKASVNSAPLPLVKILREHRQLQVDARQFKIGGLASKEEEEILDGALVAFGRPSDRASLDDTLTTGLRRRGLVRFSGRFCIQGA